MKAKFPFKTSFRLALQGKALTKAMTVFLCAFSFALFALASTGYTYSKKDYYTRALMHYSALFHSNIRGNKSVCLFFGGGGYFPL